MTSHESACLSSAGDEGARVEITAYFEDRAPSGPFRGTVPARRTLHLRFNELESSRTPIPAGTDYASIIESDAPIVVQHTRLDSGQAENAPTDTVAHADHS